MKRFSLNKGAMFGLDARIALAIFGALSVISGASLYSAIQNAKMTAMYTSLTEIEKAFEAYYLDTGDKMAYNVSSYQIGILTQDIRLPAKPDWNGPYLQTLGHEHQFAIRTKEFGLTRAVGRFTRTLNDTWDCNGESAGVDMAIYIKVDDTPDDVQCNGNLAFLKAMHDKFDNDGDYTDGKIKVVAHGINTDEGGLFYRIDLLQRRP
jgi:type II secretory pathway pseudopilin PulG